MSSDDASRVVSPAVIPNGHYNGGIDEFSQDAEISKLQKENGRTKVTL